MELTVQRLKECLDYDPKTGEFTWKSSSSRKAKLFIGKRAGSLSHWGYVEIRLDRKLYKAHRLAWLYVYGEWPAKEVDHADCNKTNNAICNLRLASVSENLCNRGKRSTNKSGFKGVSWHRGANKWVAQITKHYKCKYLGLYETAEMAADAYAMASKELHAEFARQ